MSALTHSSGYSRSRKGSCSSCHEPLQSVQKTTVTVRDKNGQERTYTRTSSTISPGSKQGDDTVHSLTRNDAETAGSSKSAVLRRLKKKLSRTLHPRNQTRCTCSTNPIPHRIQGWVNSMPISMESVQSESAISKPSTSVAYSPEDLGYELEGSERWGFPETKAPYDSRQCVWELPGEFPSPSEIEAIRDCLHPESDDEFHDTRSDICQSDITFSPSSCTGQFSNTNGPLPAQQGPGIEREPGIERKRSMKQSPIQDQLNGYYQSPSVENERSRNSDIEGGQEQKTEMEDNAAQGAKYASQDTLPKSAETYKTSEVPSLYRGSTQSTCTTYNACTNGIWVFDAGDPKSIFGCPGGVSQMDLSSTNLPKGWGEKSQGDLNIGRTLPFGNGTLKSTSREPARLRIETTFSATTQTNTQREILFVTY